MITCTSGRPCLLRACFFIDGLNNDYPASVKGVKKAGLNGRKALYPPLFLNKIGDYWNLSVITAISIISWP